MKISTKGRYALRLMIDLAQRDSGDYIPLTDISSRQDISIKYLEQIVPLLCKAGLLNSVRGKHGGYRLAIPARDCTAGDILRATEGSLAPVACLDESAPVCNRASWCSAREFWLGLFHAVEAYVDGVTLEQLAKSAQSGNDYVI